MYRGIKRSHGMVSIVNYALCTNPWSSWEFFVGLGCGVQAQVESSRRDHMLEACRPLWRQWTCEDVAVCKFKWSIMKRSNAWSLPSIVVTMDLWRCAEEWLTHSGVWGSNLLVFIEPTQSRKGGPTWGSQDRHHLAQVDYAQGKGLPLIGSLFYQSHGVTWETRLYNW